VLKEQLTNITRCVANLSWRAWNTVKTTDGSSLLHSFPSA